MPATATEKWSGQTVGKGGEPRAVRVWDVIGAIDGDDALAASGVHDVNAPYKTDDSRKCRTVDARQVSVGFWEVTANYAVPPNGEWEDEEPSADPLDEPPIIQWQSVVVTEPFDRDIDGHPIVNAAGDAHSNPPTRTYVYKVLKITKNRPSYAYSTLKQYENTVNDAPVTADGITWDTETMKCVTIEPASPYRADATVIPVTATFEIWEKTDGVATDRPFQLRILNQGVNGWHGSPAKPGHICTVEGDPVTTDKLLNSAGKPLNTQYRIKDGETIAAAAANPTAVNWCAYETTANAVFQVFKRYKTTDFEDLFAALGV